MIMKFLLIYKYRKSKQTSITIHSLQKFVNFEFRNDEKKIRIRNKCCVICEKQKNWITKTKLWWMFEQTNCENRMFENRKCEINNEQRTTKCISNHVKKTNIFNHTCIYLRIFFSKNFDWNRISFFFDFQTLLKYFVIFIFKNSIIMIDVLFFFVKWAVFFFVDLTICRFVEWIIFQFE